MPSPSFRYVEIEAATSCNYTLSQWEAEHPHYRAELIAHQMEKNIREAYLMETTKKDAKENKRQNVAGAMREGFGLPNVKMRTD